MKLSPFELEIMGVLWDKEESVVPDIHLAIKENRDVTYSTVKTIVSRLENKGAIKRIKSYGRTVLYGPAISKEELAKPMVKELLGLLYGGHVRPLMTHIMADEPLSKEDLDHLEALVQEKREALAAMV